MNRPDHHRLRWPALASAILVVVAFVASSCSEDESEDASADGSPQTLDVVVPGGETGEYSFEADLDGLSAGPVTLNLTNNGDLEHQAMLLGLHDGQSLDSVKDAAAQDPTGAKLTSLVDGYGGPSAAAPHASSSSTQFIDAGKYLLICVIPGQDALPHFAHGMVREFTVAQAEGSSDTDTEESDIKLIDFGFSVAGSLPAGEAVTVVNDGEQPHELVVARLDEGVTQADVEAAFAQDQPPVAGPPPWSNIGGIGLLGAGRSGSFIAPEEPGEYVLMCMVPDITGDQKPHASHGMINSVTIE